MSGDLSLARHNALRTAASIRSSLDKFTDFGQLALRNETADGAAYDIHAELDLLASAVERARQNLADGLYSDEPLTRDDFSNRPNMQ